MSDPVEFIFDPHVSAALICLGLALMILWGLALYQISKWKK